MQREDREIDSSLIFLIDMASDMTVEATSKEVTFLETIEHLGGLKVLVTAVVLLAVVYTLLVEWLIPRRRHHQPLLSRGGARRSNTSSQQARKLR